MPMNYLSGMIHSMHIIISSYGRIDNYVWISLNLLKKSLKENFIFGSVSSNLFYKFKFWETEEISRVQVSF